MSFSNEMVDTMRFWLESLSVTGDDVSIRDGLISVVDEYQEMKRAYEPVDEQGDPEVPRCSEEQYLRYEETGDVDPVAPKESVFLLASDVLTYTGLAALTLAASSAARLADRVVRRFE